uniref:Uncharacterized protein n=1 Tax=Anguilla anguilla TaxID=7936 RepID=A0A0E9VVH2_ANGAN
MTSCRERPQDKTTSSAFILYEEKNIFKGGDCIGVEEKIKQSQPNISSTVFNLASRLYSNTGFDFGI